MPKIPKRAPGPPKGTPSHGNAGRKPQPAQTLADAVLMARWQLFPASLRPTAKAMAAALGISAPTWHRRVGGMGGLREAQLLAANALLDAAAPTIAGQQWHGATQHLEANDPA